MCLPELVVNHERADAETACLCCTPFQVRLLPLDFILPLPQLLHCVLECLGIVSNLMLNTDKVRHFSFVDEVLTAHARRDARFKRDECRSACPRSRARDSAMDPRQAAREATYGAIIASTFKDELSVIVDAEKLSEKDAERLISALRSEAACYSDSELKLLDAQAQTQQK